MAERHKQREAEIERARKEILEPLVGTLRRSGLEVEAMVRHGHVAEVLSELAEELEATQIFIGRRGRSKLKNLLLGSVAASLVQVSPVPVTVVP